MDAIPFRRDPLGTARAPGPDASATPSVLVVDDSRFVRASLVRGLAPRFTLQQAESGERAWELLLLDPSIGAVLSDLSMPGMDGFELLRRVRGSMLERVRSLPFAVLSGADDAAQRARAEALGADRFVVKGDGVDALADWIAARLAGSGPQGAASADVAGGATEAMSVDVASGGPEAATAADAADATAEATADADAASHATPDATAAVPDGAPADAHARTGTVTRDAVATPRVPTSPESRSPEPASTRSPRLVPDPLEHWFLAATGRPAAAGDAPPALLRLHAPGLDELHARLRRGVRAADALHLDGADTAWLCVPASGALALRLAVRFGLLAAGRLALGAAPGARVSVCLVGVDPARAPDALASMRAQPLEDAPLPGVSLRALAGPWGAAWQCTLPWPAARLLVAG